jgi:adenylylsulfate kinase
MTEDAMAQTVPVLVITGPVGVGKSTVAGAVSERLGDAKLPHALVDMDHLRWCSFAPADDPFNMRLGLRNLAAVWANYAAAGAERLVVVDIVEHADDIVKLGEAVRGAEIVVVRLRATVPALHQRLEGREAGASLDWHRARAAELAAQMDRDHLEDILVDTEGKTVLEIAVQVLERVGWVIRPAPNDQRPTEVAGE